MERVDAHKWYLRIFQIVFVAGGIVLVVAILGMGYRLMTSHQLHRLADGYVEQLRQMNEKRRDAVGADLRISDEDQKRLWKDYEKILQEYIKKDSSLYRELSSDIREGLQGIQRNPRTEREERLRRWTEWYVLALEEQGKQWENGTPAWDTDEKQMTALSEEIKEGQEKYASELEERKISMGKAQIDLNYTSRLEWGEGRECWTDTSLEWNNTFSLERIRDGWKIVGIKRPSVDY